MAQRPPQPLQDPRDAGMLGPHEPLTLGSFQAGAAGGPVSRRSPAPSGARDERTIGFRGRGPRGYVRSDHDIYDDVNEFLGSDDELGADDIAVAVEGGIVTLSGRVGSRYEKRLAAVIASGARGVKDVMNQLRIEADGQGGEPRPERH